MDNVLYDFNRDQEHRFSGKGLGNGKYSKPLKLAKMSRYLMLGRHNWLIPIFDCSLEHLYCDNFDAFISHYVNSLWAFIKLLFS